MLEDRLAPTVTVSVPGPLNNVVGDTVDMGLTYTNTAGNTPTFAATGLPAGETMMGNLIYGTLTSDAVGNHSVTITATDPVTHEEGSGTFTWTVTAAAVNTPTLDLTNPNNQSSQVGNFISLSLMVTSSTGGPYTFTQTGLPDGLSVGTNYMGMPAISGTILSGAVGTHTVTITASAGGASDTETFTWTVNPKPITLTNPGDQLNSSGDTISLSLSATITTANPVSFWAMGLPSGLSMNSSTGLISGTIPNFLSSGGYFSVYVTAMDSVTYASDSQSFNWGVDTYLLSVSQADQLYASALGTAGTDRQSAIDSARAMAQSSATQAHAVYEGAVSVANATYLTNYSPAVSAYQAAVASANSVTASASNQAEGTYAAAVATAQNAFDMGVASDAQVHQAALDAADAAYSAYVAAYQTARDNAYAYYMANSNDSAALQDFNNADAALNTAIQGASAVKVTAQADAESVYQTVLTADSQTQVIATAAAVITLQASNAAADAAWTNSEATASNTFTTAKSTVDTAVSQAESNAWSSYLTSLSGLGASLASIQANIQSIFDATVANALSNWHGSEQDGWNSYLTTMANFSPAPQLQPRITDPAPVQVASLDPFAGLAVQARAQQQQPTQDLSNLISLNRALINRCNVDIAFYRLRIGTTTQALNNDIGRFLNTNNAGLRWAIVDLIITRLEIISEAQSSITSAQTQRGEAIGRQIMYLWLQAYGPFQFP